jgi:hypothetical protein
MSRTTRPDPTDPTEDSRGNVAPDRAWYERDDATDYLDRDDPAHAAWWAHAGVPLVAPRDPSRRAHVIRRALASATRHRGYTLLASLVDWTDDDELFSVLVVLMSDYELNSFYADDERNALFAALPKAVLEDAVLHELADDAMLCMPTGEDEALERYQLDDPSCIGARDGLGEWTEFRVSLRVALTT